MATLYSSVYPDEPKISLPQIQALIDSCRERQLTGLIRLAYSPEEHLYLFFKRGDVLTSSYVSSETAQVFVQSQWQEKINSTDYVHSKFVPLTPFGLFLSKLLLQTHGNKTSIFATPKQLTEYFNIKSNEKEPSFVHLNWVHAAGLVFLPGNCKDPHSIYVSQDSVLDQAGIVNAVYESSERHCSVSTFYPDASVDAWLEYQLHRVFVDISEPMLNRFETLTGRALVDSLVRLMGSFTLTQKLDISFSTRKMTDREVFASPQSAAQTYRLYLNEMFGHFSVVIGPRLLASTLREIVARLPKYEQDLIDTYSLLPGGYFYE